MDLARLIPEGEIVKLLEDRERCRRNIVSEKAVERQSEG